MNIHQISVTYVPAQDRCLVRINTLAGDELRLWFTRRLTRGLMPGLNRAAHEQQLRLHLALTAPANVPALSALRLAQHRGELMAGFQKEAAIDANDFKAPFKEQPAAWPLGAEPLVITDARLALQSNGKIDLQLVQKSDQQVRHITLSMHPQLTQGLLHLLAEALKKSQWEPLPATTPQLATVYGDDTAAGRADADRPRYLH